MDKPESSEIILAKWKDRFFAWIIDFLIISIISTSVIFLSFQYLEYNFDEFITNSRMYIPTSIMFFVYWIIIEYKTGQTIGKKIFNLKIVNYYGKNPTFLEIVASGFGKSFILPVDVILGVILTNQRRQRIFNKVGNTIIIKIKKIDESLDFKYIKD